MVKFIPYEKLSKKKKKEADRKKRGSWGVLNPVTRRTKNPRAYDRKKAKQWKNDSDGLPSFLLQSKRYSPLFQAKPLLPLF